MVVLAGQGDVMMRASGSPAFRSYDGCYHLRRGAQGQEYSCYLQIYEQQGSLPLVIVCGLTGASHVPWAEVSGVCATEIWRNLLPQAREGLRFVVGVYMPDDGSERVALHLAEAVLRLGDQGLQVSAWQVLTHAQIENWIGGPLVVPLSAHLDPSWPGE